MTTPIDPTMCLNTGRLLTEWFEHPEYTDDQLVEIACRKHGIEPEDRPKVGVHDVEHPQHDLAMKINRFIQGRKQVRWKNGMSKQEVAHRMNEATKMIDPDNYKFLDDATRERTGLEINPLWMIECLVRSGVLGPKEQVAALKELAGYTHSKAPNISHSTTTHMQPEDWLLELAKEEYQEIEIEQPKQPIERGAGKNYESRMAKRVKDTNALIEHRESELEELMKIVDAEWEDTTDDD
jgi:hypothetical protein